MQNISILPSHEMTANQDIIHSLRNQVFILNQTDPIHILPPCFLKSHFVHISHHPSVCYIHFTAHLPLILSFYALSYLVKTAHYGASHYEVVYAQGPV
jgi:hypothetical protein